MAVDLESKREPDSLWLLIQQHPPLRVPRRDFKLFMQRSVRLLMTDRNNACPAPQTAVTYYLCNNKQQILLKNLPPLMQILIRALYAVALNARISISIQP